MTTTLALGGCRPEPIAQYLKALGVLRLVSEQKDPSALGRWHGDHFELCSVLERGDLVGFLLDEYRPSPVVNPWNKDTGLTKGKLNQAVQALVARGGERFSAYRQAWEVAQSIIADMVAGSGLGPDQVRTKLKRELVLRCRAGLPDSAVAWLDAVAVLAGDGLQYPALLGTGGVMGRNEFSVTFARALQLALPPARGARALVEAALFGAKEAQLVELKIGQFDPGQAGGANSGPEGDAGALSNPWDLVLAMEGAVMFASGAARRLGWGRARAAVPFTVDASAVGYSSEARDEGGKEIWAPLWDKPASCAEVARLIGEGRAAPGRWEARTGLDFVRAVASLGVDRGVSQFVRHAVVGRHGQGNLIVAVGRFPVSQRPGVPLLDKVAQWAAPLHSQRQALSGPVATALSALDHAEFRAATEGGPEPFQAVLFALCRLEAAVWRSQVLARQGTSNRPLVARAPVSGLPAAEWLGALYDGTAEARLAVGLASLRGSPAPRHGQPPTVGEGPRTDDLASLARPLARGRRGALTWSLEPLRVAGLGWAPLPRVLAEVLVHRSLACLRAREGRSHGPEGGEAAPGELAMPGVEVGFQWGVPVPVSDVDLLARGGTDDRRLAYLLEGMLMLDWAGFKAASVPWASATVEDVAVHPALALLAPYFHGLGAGPGRPRLVPAVNWPHQLLAGRHRDVLADALGRLRWAGLAPLLARPELVAQGTDGQRLAACMLVKSGRRDLRRLLAAVAAADEEPLAGATSL